MGLTQRQELLDFRWDNVDLLTRVAKLIDIKNGQNRDVPLPSRAIDTFKKFPKSTNGFVFQTSAKAVKNDDERARKCANLQHVNFHDLRHEAVSSLLESGWNTMDAAAVSGHKDLQSLKRYTNLRAADLAKKMG
ncbi:MAG: tyrosine-type recombinase/integrase [Magnetovibrio sp.]|nr:tyrosine-type recombinase/integrase [Magnetovibrio sp.]